MCGLGNNHKVVKGQIREIVDLNKVSAISGKKKRNTLIMFLIKLN